VVKEAKEAQAAEGKVFPHGIGEERESTTEGKEGPQGPDHVPYENPNNMPPGINESFTAMEMEGWQQERGTRGEGEGTSKDQGTGRGGKQAIVCFVPKKMGFFGRSVGEGLSN
jgi:hypothetical protein